MARNQSRHGGPDSRLSGQGRIRERERTTRRPLPFYDRVKILGLLGVLFTALAWTKAAKNPLLSIRDAAQLAMFEHQWILVVAGVEVLRQVHFLLAERSTGYHRATGSVFGSHERVTSRVEPWTRFRLGRVFRVLLALFIVSVLLGALTGRPPLVALFSVPATIFSALPTILQYVIIVFVSVFQFVAIFWFMGRGGIDVYLPGDIETRFRDVWGQDAVVERIKENIVFLEEPDRIEAVGGYVPGGILLWGPPGTGKTLLAEAAAGETGKPFVFVDPGAFINMFVGVGIIKVKSLFRRLRKLALRHGGVVVFFDEADSLGNRGQLAQGGFGGNYARDTDPGEHLRWLSPAAADLVNTARLRRDTSVGEASGRVTNKVMVGMGAGGGTLQALLTELSGLKKPRGFFNRTVRKALGMRPKEPPKYRILVIMATNMPNTLDEALLRPGRLDRIYKVGYPSKNGRMRTYEGYLGRVKHDLTPAEIEKLANMTPYATGATMKDLVNEALIQALRDGRDRVEWRDVIAARQSRELGPPEDVEYIERERHAVAIHEACHGVLAYRVRKHLMIDLATIEKGGNYLGMVAAIPPEDQFTKWRGDYESEIVVALASLAGERLFFDGDNSSGVSGDLESATIIATLMEGHWGMGTSVASYAVSTMQGWSGKPGRDDTAMGGTLAARVEDKLAHLLDRAHDLLVVNRAEVLSLAHALEVYKTISGEDVAAIIDRRRGPVVDGTVYARSEVIEVLETYHAAQLRAHKNHETPTAPLPRFDAGGSVAAHSGVFPVPGPMNVAVLPGPGGEPAGEIVIEVGGTHGPADLPPAPPVGPVPPVTPPALPNGPFPAPPAREGSLENEEDGR